MYPLSSSNGVVCSVCVSVAGCVCSVISCSTARVLARVAGVVLLWLLVCADLLVGWCGAGLVVSLSARPWGVPYRARATRALADPTPSPCEGVSKVSKVSNPVGPRARWRRTRTPVRYPLVRGRWWLATGDPARARPSTGDVL